MLLNIDTIEYMRQNTQFLTNDMDPPPLYKPGHWNFAARHASGRS